MSLGNGSWELVAVLVVLSVVLLVVLLVVVVLGNRSSERICWFVCLRFSEVLCEVAPLA